MNRKTAATLLAGAAFGLGAARPWASGATAGDVAIRLSVDEDPIVVRLAHSLGFFRQEGITIVPVKVEDVSSEDYLLQRPLIAGKIDAAYHWFNHAVFGARHNLPIQAVMLFNDAPGMTILVANRMRDAIRSAADFKGRRIAEGAGYGTKSLITNLLAANAGLPPHSFTPVAVEHQGRERAVLSGLRRGEVDVMTTQEPLTDALLQSGLATTLYDLNSRASTTNVLGAAFPAQSLLMAPAFLRAHPEATQRLVNAFVRTMRFINRHSLEQIVARLPPSYFAAGGRTAGIRYLKNTLPTFARGDYAFSRRDVDLVVSSVQRFGFDATPEGRWRGTAENTHVDAASLYTNRFVRAAMKEIA